MINQLMQMCTIKRNPNELPEVILYRFKTGASNNILTPPLPIFDLRRLEGADVERQQVHTWFLYQVLASIMIIFIMFRYMLDFYKVLPF